MRSPGRFGRWMALFQLMFILWVLVVTNVEVPERATLLLSQGRYTTLATTALVWVVALLCIIAIVINPKPLSRMFWAFVIAFGGAIAWGFQHAAGIELSVFDILGFWEARHEAGNATSIYHSAIMWGAVLLVCSFAIFASPFISTAMKWRTPVKILAFSPVIPIILIAGIVFIKGGNGHFAMPKQFSQWSLASLVAAKSVYRPKLERLAVTFKPVPAKATEKILVLMDESVRPDYASSDLLNTDTPHFASFARRMVNYGPAVSGAICSNYSNAIIRYMASRADIGDRINTNPTIWDYAKAAGYRTVYIDAQAHAIENATRMQNFMTVEERKSIDSFNPLINVRPDMADFRLVDIIAKEMAKPGKVFIFANKQGAHFPYDQNYLPADAKFRPTQSEVGEIEINSMINSYRNAVQNNVDRFFVDFAARVDLANTALIYTSDHGQYFKPGQAAHCKSSDTFVQSSLVPLYAMHSDPAEQSALAQGAKATGARANHFQIPPTLLHWMGYNPKDTEKRYTESLLAGATHAPAYTVGDVFGLFSYDVDWVQVDLTQDYVEPQAKSPKLVSGSTTEAVPSP